MLGNITLTLVCICAHRVRAAIIELLLVHKRNDGC